MSFGQTKFYGRNIRLEDMMGVYHFLYELQYEGFIQILTVNYEFITDTRLHANLENTLNVDRDLVLD